MKKIILAAVASASTFIACNAVAPGLDFAGCVLKTYGDDYGKPQDVFVNDAIQNCGGQAVDVLRVLEMYKAAKARETGALGSPNSTLDGGK